MIKIDLSLFGGRGGDSTSARWMDGFFKSASNGAKDSDVSVRESIDAAKAIYKALVKEKISSSFMDKLYKPKERLIEEWVKRSSVAKYDSENLKLVIEKGKMAQARREFENFIKNKFWDKYLKGRPAPRRGVHSK